MDKIEKKKKIESEKIPTQNTRPRAEAAQTARRQCGIHVEERVASACVAWKRHRGCNATVCGQAVTGPSGPSDMSGSARQGAAELRRQGATNARCTPATVWRNSHMNAAAASRVCKRPRLCSIVATRARHTTHAPTCRRRWLPLRLWRRRRRRLRGGQRAQPTRSACCGGGQGT